MIFFRCLKREWLLISREPRFVLNALLFFVMMGVFFPLTLPADNRILQEFAPGLIWMTTVLTMMLACERLFQQDYEEGVLEQWLISGYSLLPMITAKLVVYWAILLLPLLIFSPLLAIFFHFSVHTLLILILSLLIGTPSILGICALTSVFSLNLQQKSGLMALILLPLVLPILILASGVVLGAMQGQAANGLLAILLACSLLVFGFVPFVISKVMCIMG